MCLGICYVGMTRQVVRQMRGDNGQLCEKQTYCKTLFVFMQKYQLKQKRAKCKNVNLGECQLF